MTAFEMLLKCGYSPEQSSTISKTPIPNDYSRAAINEQKYSSIPDTDLEWWKRKHKGGVYSEINAGTDNGECTTRRGTYRKLKTGDGRYAS